MRNFVGTKMSAAEENVRLAFRVSLFIKAVFALLEIAGGVLAYFISQEFLVGVITAITQDELIEDPNDFIANQLLHLAQQFSISTQYFTAFYLLSHGVIKLFLIAGLLRERLWYYPLAMIVFAFFIMYQLYRFSFTHSVWLLVITILRRSISERVSDERPATSTTLVDEVSGVIAGGCTPCGSRWVAMASRSATTCRSR